MNDESLTHASRALHVLGWAAREHRTETQFVAIPNRGGCRLLVASGGQPWRRRAIALQSYAPQTTLGHLRKTVLRTGLLASTIQADSTNLEHVLHAAGEHLAECPTWCAVLVPAHRPERPTLQLSRGRRVLGYARAGDASDHVAGSAVREDLALTLLHESHLGRCVPRPLGTIEAPESEDEIRLHFRSTEEDLTSGATWPMARKFLVELGALDMPSAPATLDASALRGLLEHAQASDALARSETLVSALERWVIRAGSGLPPAHGDFTPWNLRTQRDGTLFVIDWERFGPQPPLYDAACYASARWLDGRRRPSPASYLAALAESARDQHMPSPSRESATALLGLALAHRRGPKVTPHSARTALTLIDSVTNL